MHLSAVRILLEWLNRHQGKQKFPQVMRVLAERAEDDLNSGRSVTGIEVETLQTLFFDATGGRPTSGAAGKWLKRSDFVRWWRHECRAQIAAECRLAGLSSAPELTCPPHPGGRGNSTEYKLLLEPLENFGLGNEDETPCSGLPSVLACDPGVISYRADSARPPFWARGWWIKEDGFSTWSWRGLLLLLVLLGALAAASIVVAAVALVLWTGARWEPKHAVLVGVAAASIWTFWTAVRPLARLPTQRMDLAPAWLLGFDQFHGQVVLRRGGPGRLNQRGWFSLVRHWSTCPLCSGEVDLARGDPEFPGRLVGRCADSPAEHVFSFDPISLAGRSLRS